MKDRILARAVKLSERDGYTHLTRSKVATSARCAPGLVSYYFGSMRGLQNSVVADAVANEREAIVAQALIAKHPAALKAPKALRERAIASIAG